MHINRGCARKAFRSDSSPNREGAVVRAAAARFGALPPLAVVSLTAEARTKGGVLELALASPLLSRAVLRLARLALALCGPRHLEHSHLRALTADGVAVAPLRPAALRIMSRFVYIFVSTFFSFLLAFNRLS